MMRKVQLIKSFNVEEVMAGDSVQMFEHSMGINLHPVYGVEDTLIAADETVESKILPVIELIRMFRDPSSLDPYSPPPFIREEIYVAYSEEVEELICTPIRELYIEKERLKAENAKHKQSFSEIVKLVTKLEDGIDSYEGSFWKRLKFLFTGVLKEAK